MFSDDLMSKMQDRFKFRAKLKDMDKWIYGAYLKMLPYQPYPVGNVKPLESEYKHLIIIEDSADWGMPRGIAAYEVIPETVGQCIGKKDKNRKLIYEGDIVEVQYGGAQISLFKNEYSQQPENERFEIFCHPEWLKFYAKNDHYRKTCEIHSLDLEKISVNDYNKSYEVIGNIYDNPELLKGGNL